MKIEFTHVGWFSVAPVYFTEYKGEVLLASRWGMGLLLELAFRIEFLRLYLKALRDPLDDGDGFMFRIRQLEKPVLLDWPETQEVDL